MHSSSKLRDVSILCALDYCRGAARVKPDGDLPIRSIAFDLAHDIRVSSRSTVGKVFDIVLQSALLQYHDHKPFWEAPEEIDVSMFADALVLLYRFSPLEEAHQLFKTCLEPERSDAVKLCVIKACVTLSVEVYSLYRIKYQINIKKICLSPANFPGKFR